MNQRTETAALTDPRGYFEDFYVGQRLRHARGATIGEFENAYLSKQVMNTAQPHWNEHWSTGTTNLLGDVADVLGEGRVVFGLVTGSVVFGLASQDIAENALAEVGCTGLRFLAPVHHGDTLYAYTEIRGVEPSADRDDAGLVHVHHWGVTHDDRVVFEGDRTVLVKRRCHWGGVSPAP